MTKLISTGLILIVAASASDVLGQELRRDRFFGTIQIGQYLARIQPFDGGVGGFDTDFTPVYADVVVMVEEGQNLTWEWIGIRPETASREGFPNITLEVSPNRAEFNDLTVDLNPSGANLWAGPSASLQYDRLTVEGRYSSFSFQSEFSGIFQPDNQGEHGFVVTPTLDYSRFPDELEVHVNSKYQLFPCCGGGLLSPRTQVVLEPKLELSLIDMRGVSRRSARLLFTPTGDANNDGTVSFDDFLILANGFGQQAEAAWADGDFDDDGDVDFTDFLGLAANFGGGQEAASVPEPSSTSTVWLALAILIHVQRWIRRGYQP